MAHSENNDYIKSEGMSEECGVFGIYDKSGKRKLAYETYRALFSLQHRGQESCGIAINDDGILTCQNGMGLVSDVFNERVLDQFPATAKMAIGHVRYATCGSRDINNAQPMVVHHSKGALGLCHNGNVTNARELRLALEGQGSIFHGSSDSEVIVHKIVKNRINSSSIEEAILKTMNDLVGAYCLVVMSATKLIAARDPQGIRPLCIGVLEGDEGYVVASESCALDIVGATFLRDVKPGEVVVIDRSGIKSHLDNVKSEKPKICVFEYMYFARPDSIIEGTCVHEARLEAGKLLARSHPADADVVIGAPDSGLDAAQGYAIESGIPYAAGIVKSKYVGRTFIKSTQTDRVNAVRIKLNPIPSVVSGKSVVLVDDSIVRGTTSKRLIELLYRAGAKEVHFRVSSPPFRYPCYFGTDVPDADLLVATNRTESEIGEVLGCDSIGYLSLEDSRNLAINSDCDFCTGCFSGDYPCEIKSSNIIEPYERPLSLSGTGKVL